MSQKRFLSVTFFVFFLPVNKVFNICKHERNWNFHGRTKIVKIVQRAEATGDETDYSRPFGRQDSSNFKDRFGHLLLLPSFSLTHSVGRSVGWSVSHS